MGETETNPSIGQSWDEVEKEVFTSEEIAKSHERVTVIGDTIRVKQKKNFHKSIKKK